MKVSSSVATLLGITSILQWGSQVLLSTYVVLFPPFQIMAMTFFLAFAVMLITWVWRRESPLKYAHYGLRVWMIGLGGFFGYYILFYTALSRAPAIEVTLLVNLWPLLMVLFSGWLPGERLHGHQFLACVIGAFGSALLVGPGALAILGGDHLVGQVLAGAAAVVWAAFCVLSRTIGNVPTDTVGWYCLATAVLAAACHAVFEPTVLTAPSSAWWAAVALGVGPIGCAFFAWDAGLKHGNLQLLGIMAFFIPMLSALLLVVSGRGVLDVRTATAMCLISGGALIGARAEVFGLIKNLRRGTTISRATR